MRVGKRHPLYTAKREIRRRGITCSFWTARPGSGSSRHPGGSLGGTTYGFLGEDGRFPLYGKTSKNMGTPFIRQCPGLHPGLLLGHIRLHFRILLDCTRLHFRIFFGLYQITFQDSFGLYQITFQASFGLCRITFQTTYYIPPGDCRRRTAWLIFFILKKTHPSWLFMSMSWIGKNLQLAHLETQLASLRC